MDLKTIQIEFGEKCECENDVVKECLKRTNGLIEALKVLGMDISRSNNLNYIHTYLLLKLQDTAKEKHSLEKEKQFFNIKRKD